MAMNIIQLMQQKFKNYINSYLYYDYYYWCHYYFYSHYSHYMF